MNYIILLEQSYHRSVTSLSSVDNIPLILFLFSGGKQETLSVCNMELPHLRRNDNTEELSQECRSAK